MTLLWVTGTSGTGKSTVCAALKARGEFAADADFDGFNYWFDRVSGEVLRNPPCPVPAVWLRDYAWRIDRRAVERMAEQAADRWGYLCGSVENEDEVWDVFDRVVCLAADDETIRTRLAARTANSFGGRPEELAAVLTWNATAEADYRRYGATIVDATQPLENVVEQVLGIAQSPGV